MLHGYVVVLPSVVESVLIAGKPGVDSVAVRFDQRGSFKNKF